MSRWRTLEACSQSTSPFDRGVSRANGLMVFTLAGHQISAMTRFDTSVLAMFKLAATLPA